MEEEKHEIAESSVVPPAMEVLNAPFVPVLINRQMLLIGLAIAMIWAAGVRSGALIGTVGHSAQAADLSQVTQICGTGFLLPVIQRDLSCTRGQVQWVNNAFNITWGSFSLVPGRLSDFNGLRNAYLLGLL